MHRRLNCQKTCQNLWDGVLVSKLCYIIDVYLLEERQKWKLADVDLAVNHILHEQNTNFDSLIANLENNKDLYTFVEKILLSETKIEYNEDSSIIKLGATYGIFRNNGKVAIHNRIYEERIYNYMALNLKIKELLNSKIENYNFSNNFILPDNNLNFKKVILRFQQFMKEQYTKKDDHFVEYNWRLLYLAFIKPIINGHGFDFKEAQISEEKRLDVVITYYNRRYINELKIWNDPKKHKAGLLQLSDYLERQSVDKGYLVIFDFRKEMKYKIETVTVRGKEIFTVWV